MKRIINIANLVALLAVLLTVSGWAQEVKVYREGNTWVEETRGTMSAAKGLKIQTDVGAVRVQGGAQPDVSYVIRKRVYAPSEAQARKEFELFRVSATKDGETAVIRGECHRTSSKGRYSLDFQVTAPRGLSAVSAETGAGPVIVNAIAGKVQAETGGGPIAVDDIDGVTELSTGGGPIQVGSVRNNLTLETGGGEVRVGKVGGWLDANTGGGNLDLGEIGGAAKIETGGGNIHLVSAKGLVSAETGGGNIELWGLMNGVHATSGAGQILVFFDKSTRNISESRLETNAGNVTVSLPSLVPMTVRATVEAGSPQAISSEFNEVHVVCEHGFGPQSCYAEGRLNSGGPLLKIGTSVGNIQIRASK